MKILPSILKHLAIAGRRISVEHGRCADKVRVWPLLAIAGSEWLGAPGRPTVLCYGSLWRSTAGST